MITWDAEKLQAVIYHENVMTKTIKFMPGQGPQDMQLLSAILATPTNFIVWDRRQRRFSYFNKQWQFDRIKKFPLLGNASPIAATNDKFLFQWSHFVHGPKGSEITQNIGLINATGQKSILINATSPFNDKGAENFDRPYLIAGYDNNTLYYANNRDYKVYTIDLKDTRQSPRLYLQKNVKPVKWDSRLSELPYEVIKKPQHVPKYVYPEYIPPIFTIFVYGDTVGVVSNQAILKKRSVVDFFKKGKYTGSVELPLLFNQYFVFPSTFYFSPGINMNRNYLYSFHYDTESDTYKVIKWEIK